MFTKKKILKYAPLILAVIGVGVALPLTHWRQPAQVAAVINTSRVRFDVGNKSMQTNPLKFENITFYGFSEVDPAFPFGQSWMRDTSLTFASLQSRNKATAGSEFGVLRAFQISPETTTEVYAEGANRLCFELTRRQAGNIELTFDPPDPLRASFNSTYPPVKIIDDSDPPPFITIKSTSGFLRACLDVTDTQPTDLVSNGVPITVVAFKHQDDDPDDKRFRTVSDIKSGELKYRGHAANEAVGLTAGEFVNLGELDQSFTLRRIVKGPGPDELFVHLDGVAGKIDVGHANSVKDVRPKFLDDSARGMIAQLVAIAAVLFSATLAVKSLRLRGSEKESK